MGVPMVTRTVLVPIDLYAEIVNYADSHEISWAAAVSIIAVTFFVFSAGFWIGTGWSTGGGDVVYSTDSAQCPTDATFCQQVNTWKRSDAGSTTPNAYKERSSVLITA